jgi:hypothetical protein
LTIASRVNEALPWRASHFTVPLLIAVTLVVVLLTPGKNTGSSGDTRLSSFLSGPAGAKGIFDVAQRLGWKVERRTRAPFDSLNPGSIVALLAPQDQLSERETSLLLDKVRAGASLLAVAVTGPLQDSLHLPSGESFVQMPVFTPDKTRCPANDPRSVYGFMGDRATGIPFSRSIKVPEGATTFVRMGYPDQRQERFAALGFSFGKGRVVAVSDANLLRNDYIRICKWGLGVAALQIVDYLTAGRSRADTRIVFDEYHQGFGPQPSVTRAIRRVLFSTAPGAMLFQILIASGILLLAISPRPIPPVPSPRAQRRSQFEHVAALSSAYRQISATRTATQRLVRGLQRRLATEQRVAAGQSDDAAAFLRQVAASHPVVASQAALLSSALTQPGSPAALVAVGEAINTIERTIKR